MDSVEQLFARFARHGDVDALGEVFDRSAPSLLRLAVPLCGREADADIVHRDELAPATEPQQTRRLALGIGGYVVRIAADGGQRYEGAFAIGELLRDGPVIDVAVGEVR